ncbi:MAG: hypothetical protein U0520_00035 [Candidatus Saccharimonadales bacterium]
MPDSVYVGHINIGGQPGTKITPHTEGVTSPTVLPSKLHDVLADYIKRGIV